MPKNVIITDRADLESVAVPTDVASHKYIMDKIAAELAVQGIQVKTETYLKNLNGQIATGILELNIPSVTGTLTPVIFWTNAYDRTVKFKCAAGAKIDRTGGYIINPDDSGLKVNPLDSATDKVDQIVSAQTARLTNNISSIINDLESMQDKELDDEKIAHVMGELYYMKDAITSSQLIKIKDKCSADNIYNTLANTTANMHSCHPKSFIDQHVDVYETMMKWVNELTTLEVETETEGEEAVNPNQLSILDQIEEEEEKMIVSDDQGPLDLDNYGKEGQIEEAPEVEPIAEAPAEEVLEEALDKDELLSSDADVDSKAEPIEQDPDNLSLDAHNPLPEPPADLPVSGEDTDMHVEEEIVDEDVDKLPAIPLEEQVAGEYVEEVTEEEKTISAKPIVDEPVAEEPKPSTTEEAAEDLSFLEEGPTEDPVFTPEPEPESSTTSTDDPFEF